MSFKTKNVFFAILWIIIFAVFAYYIYSGKLFEPDANGKINIVAVLVGWIVQYVGKTGTAIIAMAIGIGIAMKVGTSKV